METSKSKEKVAIVTVRYGEDVQGGEETRARYYAEILNTKYDVEVLTTKAKDFATWANEIETDQETVNGVFVKRFATDHSQQDHGKYSNPNNAVNARNSLIESEKFIEALGPYSSSLFNYIKEHQQEYKYIIYMPYLYATTYFGALNSDVSRNILAPAAHDEDYLRYKYFAHVMTRFERIIFNINEERDLIYKLYPSDYKYKIVGIPIEPVKPSTDFIQKYNIEGNYILYFGRIDQGKGVNKLIEYFITFKEKYPENNIKLLLAGKTYIDIPKREDIKFIGFVSEEDKSAAIINSKVVLLPSQWESFSIATLEGMALGRAVLVNAKSEVLKGHCIRSNGGLWYETEKEFIESLNYLLTNENEREEMGNNGKKYAQLNYTHEKVAQRLLEFVE